MSKKSWMGEEGKGRFARNLPFPLNIIKVLSPSESVGCGEAASVFFISIRNPFYL
jgi:hypothetical protein